MFRRLRIVFFLAGIVFIHGTAIGQPGGPPCGSPPCGGPGKNPNVPLGGIELLIAAGAAFGAKKWFDKNKK